MENEKNDYTVELFARLLKTELLAVAVFAIVFLCASSGATGFVCAQAV